MIVFAFYDKKNDNTLYRKGYTFSTSIYKGGGVNFLLLATVAATGGISLGGGMVLVLPTADTVGVFCGTDSGGEIFSSFLRLLPSPLKYIF